MSKLFLTSSLNTVGKHLFQDLDVKGFKAVCIETASELDTDRTMHFYDRDALVDAGLNVIDYTLTSKTPEDLTNDLKDMDILYVGGGNIFYLLERVQESGFAEFVHKHVNSGKIYIGTSAGSLIAGPDVWVAHREDALKKVPKLESYKGLGLVDFCVFSHWGSKEMKSLYLTHRMEHNYNTNNKIILLTDNQYVEVKDGWYKIVDATK